MLTILPLVIASLLAPPGFDTVEAPPFHLHYPPELTEEARSIAAASPRIIAHLSHELDSPPLPPVTLYLVPGRGSATPVPHERLMPEWAAGIAMPEADTVIIRTDRIGPYGQRQLLGVFAHEAAHLLMARAAGRGDAQMPPWFSEGVAANLARDGELMEFLYLWLSPVASSRRPLDTLNECFGLLGTPSLRRAAYAGSYSFVRFAMTRHGLGLPRQVLAGLAAGRGFGKSWLEATGSSLAEDEEAWSASIRGSRRWFAILTSSFALWLGTTLLLLLAYRIKRGRSRRLLEEWNDDDGMA